ncbi:MULTISPECIES: hypothetical protein [unclassified Mesorhizobium]|uniref:hypothetical protein n=1 Tax=unclassified Mesorhizobium TaxID=325217 RepID=UPI001FEFD7B2|nr:MULTISPECIES: hypothetical protein [unclassified Mesorhizobium]
MIVAVIDGQEKNVPDDLRNMHRQAIEAWVAAGGEIAPYVAPPPSMDDYSIAIQLHLDATAATRQYDSIQTAVTYRGDSNPVFAAEADALFAWRSSVWTYATEELARVMAGERTQPTVVAFIAELPEMVWP